MSDRRPLGATRSDGAAFAGTRLQTCKFIVPNAAGWSRNIPQGIFRSALLHVYPDVYISDAFVKTSVTDDTILFEETDESFTLQ